MKTTDIKGYCSRCGFLLPMCICGDPKYEMNRLQKEIKEMKSMIQSILNILKGKE